MKTVQLRVPSPADPARLDRFIAANLHGLSRKRAKGLIDAGQVRVGGRIERRAGRALTPGEFVQIDWRPSLLGEPPLLTRARVVAAGPDWWAIDKPPGLPSHRTEDDGIGAAERLARALGDAVDRAPAHRLDRGTSGVLLLARGAALAELSGLFARREMEKTYVAVVAPPPPEDSGTLVDAEADMRAGFTVARRSEDGTRAEVRVTPREGRTHQVRRLLAAAGSPIVGDLEHGRALPGGAPRMALHCAEIAWPGGRAVAPPPADWEQLLNPARTPQPDPKPRREPRREPRERRTSRRRTVRVSAASARIIKGGHPWVLRDRDTGSMRGMAVGDIVDLEDPGGEWVAAAVVEPAAELCARVLSLRPNADLSPEGLAARATRAVAKRAVVGDRRTTAYRLLHGEADGLPGLHVDRWGPALVATRTTPAAAAYADIAYDAVSRALPGLPLYEKDHFADLRARDGAAGDALPGRWRRGSLDTDTVEILEAGLRYEATPFGGLTTGFYPDQRANRALLTATHDLDGARVANLFAHTGAFSVALAAAGAAQVFSVDLSPRYLAIAEANLRRNGLAPDAHPLVATDAVRWIAAREGDLDGVIIDPPVFAQGRGRGRGFSAKDDYRAIVAAAARALGEGGWMLCCRNLRGDRRGRLRTEVERGLEDAGRRPRELRNAGPAPDHPVLRGFPEGTTFHGVHVRL